jgi:hypothetical protein
VRIDQLRCDQDLDVLIAGPTTFRRRLHVATTDFVKADPGDETGAGTTPPVGSKNEPARVARVSAK